MFRVVLCVSVRVRNGVTSAPEFSEQATRSIVLHPFRDVNSHEIQCGLTATRHWLNGAAAGQFKSALMQLTQSNAACSSQGCEFFLIEFDPVSPYIPRESVVWISCLCMLISL